MIVDSSALLSPSKLAERYVGPPDAILLEVSHYELLDVLDSHGLCVLRGLRCFDVWEVSGALFQCVEVIWRVMGRSRWVVERFICFIEVFLDRFDELAHFHAH